MPDFGEIAGIVGLTACPIYVHDILRGTARPNRATWWIITLVGCVIAASYWESGGRATIWIALAYIFSPFVIAVLSIKYGDGQWQTLDRLCCLGAVISVGMWWITSSALAALSISIVVDLLGLLPTFVKAYSKPLTESKVAWGIAALASFINILAIERWNFAIAAYPLYLLATNGLMIGIILYPRRKSFSASRDNDRGAAA
jgi:hypothetical protein